MSKDLFDLPRNTLNMQEFFASSGGGAGAATKHFQIWRKPLNCSMVHIVILGAGAGGGGGFTAAAGSARGGGAGGGSGALVRASFPAFLIPDILYLQIPNGGAGGAAGATGSVGGRTYVSVAPQITVAYCLMISGAADAAAGGGGSGALPGNGGSGSTIASNVTATYTGLATSWLAIAGQSGAGGGAVAGAAGSAIAPLAAGIWVSGGAGGGGTPTGNTDFAGGAVSAAGLMLAIPGGVAAAGKGGDGTYLDKPFTCLGGGGGGTAGASGIAGAGGNGSFGSGGGGGGGGVTGGAGGNGGDGWALIISQ